MMKILALLSLLCLAASCSSSDEGRGETGRTDVGVPASTVDGAAPATDVDAPAGADADSKSVPDAAPAPVDAAPVDAAQVPVDAAPTPTDAASTSGDALPAPEDASPPPGDAALVTRTCPASLPDPYGKIPCAVDGNICEYFFPLSCPVGCSGGDYHAVQCNRGIWTDYRHTAGAPQCGCSALDFPKGMQGTWLVGPPGLATQRSWIRFSALGTTLSDAGSPGQGTIDILSVVEAPVTSPPWWMCDGKGRWFITQSPDSLEVRPPSTCSSRSTSEIYTVTSRQSAIPSTLLGCLLHITLESATGAQLDACKYSDSQCNEAMTTCQAPR